VCAFRRKFQHHHQSRRVRTIAMQWLCRLVQKILMLSALSVYAPPNIHAFLALCRNGRNLQRNFPSLEMNGSLDSCVCMCNFIWGRSQKCVCVRENENSTSGRHWRREKGELMISVVYAFFTLHFTAELSSQLRERANEDFNWINEGKWNFPFNGVLIEFAREFIKL
jgi:hypothetical protein